MKIVFLETASLGEDMSVERFSQLGEVTVYEKTLPEQVPERISDAEVVIVNKLPMNETTLNCAKNLKLIGITATGTNNIDFAYTDKRGICVTNVAGYSTDAVAQHTFALLFYLMEHLRYYDDYVKSGAYVKSESFCHLGRKYHELAGKTWGIIGLGAIGTRTAQIARAFGCNVIYYSTSGRNSSTEYERTDLDTLLATADIVSIHAPLTDKTFHLMNAEAFSKMKKEAILINVARGPLVAEADLVDALKEGKLAAAAMDVLEQEPMTAENPLHELKDCDRLLITPHIAWAPVETRARLLDEVWENIAAFQRGEKRNVCIG